MTWPAPLHTSRDPWPDGLAVPGPAAKLEKLAAGHGWRARCTYAHGYTAHGVTGAPVLVHSVAVRFRREARGGVVVYESKADAAKPSWSAKTLMLWGDDHGPVVSVLGVTDVQEYLRHPKWTGAEVGAWHAGLRKRAAEAKQRARDATKARPKKAKVHA